MPLCENNARAEGVENVSFRQGDATHLDFQDETFDAVASNYVYHNIPSKDRQAILGDPVGDIAYPEKRRDIYHS